MTWTLRPWRMSDAGALAALLQDGRAVSYTHLDVYKRQYVLSGKVHGDGAGG